MKKIDEVNQMAQDIAKQFDELSNQNKYVVIEDTFSFSYETVVFEGSKNECENYLNKNNHNIFLSIAKKCS